MSAIKTTRTYCTDKNARKTRKAPKSAELKMFLFGSDMAFWNFPSTSNDNLIHLRQKQKNN